MPRLSTLTILEAYRYNPFLPLLLRECRSLQSARNELRWLRERALHVIQLKSANRRSESKDRVLGWRGLLKSMCLARSKGMPLQYIIGDQPFGCLDIMCKKDVLIPRPETETITIHTADLILRNISRDGSLTQNRDNPLRIIDLCTGTGCIALLLHALLSPHFQQLSIIGIDISDAALRLARKNTGHNVRQGLLSKRALSEVSFRAGSVLDNDENGFPPLEYVLRGVDDLKSCPKFQCDVLISNPPYISLAEFRNGTTSRSVRIFEPQLALVPPRSQFASIGGSNQHEDIFYHHIVSLVSKFHIKLAVVECGSRIQASRVASCFRAIANEGAELSVQVWPVDDGSEIAPHAVIVWKRAMK